VVFESYKSGNLRTGNFSVLNSYFYKINSNIDILFASENFSQIRLRRSAAMKFLKMSTIILTSIILAIVLASCSGSSKNQTPLEPDNQVSDLPSFGTGETSGRTLLAIYDAVIDPIAKTFTVTPDERTADYHFPLTQLYPNVLQITGFGFIPNLWADIKLKHPFPGSGIEGFDPRVIAILPANLDVSFDYPMLDVSGNNSVVLEPDGYTKLFDNLSGTIVGNTNPFKAYFKNQPNRVWSDTGVTEETQRWQMDLAGFGGQLRYKLVVDVSTNFPDPPTPVTDNAAEPVQIDVVVGPGLTQNGGSTDIDVTLLDWQGHAGIGGVQVEAPDLFDGIVILEYSAPGPNPNEYVYTGTIANSLHAPFGEYKIMVATWDQVTGIYIYNEVAVIVNYMLDEGNLIWAKRAGGTDYEYGEGITTLSDDSTIVTGWFRGKATFGKEEPNQTVLLSDGYSYCDIFIARYNLDGTLAWAKRAGGEREDKGFGIIALSDDSIVIIGYFEDLSTFGFGEPNQTILTSAGYKDIFIARYNPDGSLAWAKRAGGASWDEGFGITTLSDDSTVVTGRFGLDNGGSATFGQGEPNETILTSAGVCDIFIARYNPDGTLSWAKRAGGTSSECGYGITTLSDDSTVVTGTFWASATFGPGEINEIVLTSAGAFDMFIARYNPDGTLAWAKRAGGVSGEESWGITTLSNNSTIVTGSFWGPATFGQGEPNQTVLTSYGIFIARYNPDGTLAWAKRAGGAGAGSGKGITTLSNNSTVVTGYFYGSATFGPDEPNQTVLDSAGGADIFIARYNPDGTLAWAKRAGGSVNDEGWGIASLSDNSTVATGYFGYPDGGTATFGLGEPNETVLTSAYTADIFIARFAP